MTESPRTVEQVTSMLAELVGLVDRLAESGDPVQIRSALLTAEGAIRGLAAASTRAVATARREGVFAAAGYRTDAAALADLLQWDLAEAKRRIAVADNVTPDVSHTGEITPPRLETAAKLFHDGGMSIRHVEVLSQALDSRAARRIPTEDWATAERHLAELAPSYTPRQLDVLATDLITTLDQDGPEPDDREPNVNELRITRHRDGGGTLTAHYDDTAQFGTILAVLDAKSAPLGGEDQRSAPQRQADALVEVCGFAHTHDHLAPTGGRRAQLTVTIELADLEQRARRANLDTGDRLTPAQLRMLACDADVIPVVLNGARQPVDVGRKRRIVPEPLRRAVAARDRGCARPGCDRPPSWCEVHHVISWEHGGSTDISNLVLLCRHDHRQVHHVGWEITMTPGGTPVFRPPAWVDPRRAPLAQVRWSKSPRTQPMCRSAERRTTPAASVGITLSKLP